MGPPTIVTGDGVHFNGNLPVLDHLVLLQRDYWLGTLRRNDRFVNLWKLYEDMIMLVKGLSATPPKTGHPKSYTGHITILRDIKAKCSETSKKYKNTSKNKAV